MTAPGAWLYRLASFVCRPSTIARLIDPWLADFQFEYGAAAFGRARAAWVRVVHSIAFVRLVTVGVLAGDRASTTRLIAWIAGCTAVMTLLFTWPIVALWSGRPQVFLLIVPSALAVAIPLGAALGTTFAVRPNRVSRELRALAVGLAFFSAIGNGVVAWQWMPAANQAFRVETFRLVTGNPRANLRKGPNELTLRELRREILQQQQAGASNLNPMRIALHGRVALAVLPFTLVLCSFALAGRYRRGWALALTVIVLEMVCFSSQPSQMRYGDAPLMVALGAWIPTLLPLAIAMAARLGGVTDELPS